MSTIAGSIPKPPIWRLLTEVASIASLSVNSLRAPVDCAGPGNGWPVLVIPGFTISDCSTSLLRRSLDQAGFRTYGWGQGVNIGLRPGVIEKLEGRVAEMAEKEDRKVVLLGWSLGGVYARIVANRNPRHIAEVVTLSSPFSGSPRANRAWRLYNLFNDHTVDHPPEGIEFRTKPPVHTIAVWTARDGIVAPESARGLPEESDVAVEFDVTHFGYCASAGGVRQIADLLAAHLTE